MSQTSTGNGAIKNATPIARNDVPGVVSVIKKALPEELLSNLQMDIGSAGFKDESGDIDLMVDSFDVIEYFQSNNSQDAKKELQKYLEQRGYKAVTKGRNVHVGVPYKDQSGDSKLAQVDIMVIDDAASVAPWHQHGPRGMYAQPGFKGSSNFILMSSIAKHMGLKFDAFGGKLVDRNTEEVVGKSRRQVAKILLGPKAKEKDLDSVSSIMARLADDPDREGKLAQARQDAQAGLLELPEDVYPGTKTWLNQMEESPKFAFVKSLKENHDTTGRTPHPEDSIFDGSNAAAMALQSLGGVIANPSKVTVKWDGFPALIFGRTPEGKLAIMDKYMFDKRILATSPQDWQQYDSTKPSGTMRPDLYTKLASIWAGLDAVVKGEGFFWGDLLWAGALNPVKGNYVFKPNTVEYHVPVQSQIGQTIKGSSGGIVVHQHFGELGGTASEWDGKGLVTVPGGVTIIKPGLGIRFSLRDPVSASKAAAAAVEKYGTAVDDLFVNIPSSTKALIKTYFNKKITCQTNQDLHDWMKGNVSSKQYNALVGDDYSGSLFTTDGEGQVHESQGYAGLKAIWNSIYAYKLNLVQQLEQQVQGVQQSVNGQAGGEGFVFPSPNGLIKLVNRGQFSRALFNK
jgi:hypothetical protein